MGVSTSRPLSISSTDSLCLWTHSTVAIYMGSGTDSMDLGKADRSPSSGPSSLPYHYHKPAALFALRPLHISVSNVSEAHPSRSVAPPPLCYHEAARCHQPPQGGPLHPRWTGAPQGMLNVLDCTALRVADNCYAQITWWKRKNMRNLYLLLTIPLVGSWAEGLPSPPRQDIPSILTETKAMTVLS